MMKRISSDKWTGLAGPLAAPCTAGWQAIIMLGWLTSCIARGLVVCRDEREREAKEAEERERWRNMSEEERQRWLRLHPKGQTEGPKKKWRFLQKYWHRGAFFQTEADTGEGEDEGVATTIARRDFSAPTGEDKMDKAILPQIMQVRTRIA